MAARPRPVLLPPYGLTQAEADALPLPTKVPRPLAEALATILVRLAKEKPPLAESDATLSADPAVTPAS